MTEATTEPDANLQSNTPSAGTASPQQKPPVGPINIKRSSILLVVVPFPSAPRRPKPETPSEAEESFEKGDTEMENGGGRSDVPDDANERKRSLLFSLY